MGLGTLAPQYRAGPQDDAVRCRPWFYLRWHSREGRTAGTRRALVLLHPASLVAEHPDYEGLRDLALQIMDGLSRSSDIAQQVRVMLDNKDDGEVRRELASIREVEPRAAGVIDRLLQEEPGADSARAVLISGCLYVEEHAWDERNHLSGKVQQLDAGKLPDPDFRLPFKCALTLVGIAATAVVAGVSVATAVGIIPAAALGAAIGAGGMSQVWTTSGCPER